MALFPLFMDIDNKPCLVVGGGRIAFRKINVLRDFGADVIVVACEICPQIRELTDITIIEKDFSADDCTDMTLVIAATGNAETDLAIASECKKAKIPVNVISKGSGGSFSFPAYIKQGNAVAAFSGGGESPLIAQKLKAEAEAYMTPLKGELADLLSALRKDTRIKALPEEKRKALFAAIYDISTSQGKIPEKEELTEIISNGI